MSSYNLLLSSMQERYRSLTGFDADNASDVGIRLKILAAELADLLNELETLRQQVFAQTSSGEYLNMHAQTRGLLRKPAQKAQGILRFSRETQAVNNLVIPSGTTCATKLDPPVHFATIQDAVLPAGSYAVDVPAEAIDAGEIGNVAPGAVCLMVSVAAGVSQVSNTHAFEGGVDAEGDDSLRKRLLQSYQSISNGTNRAFYYDQAMKSEGVTSANILPRERGRGTVDVVVSCASKLAQEQTITSLEQQLAESKEIGVDVLVRAAQEDPLTIRAAIAVEEGCSLADLEPVCKQKIRTYIDSRGVGNPVLLAQLGRALLEVEGVYNYRLSSPQTDIHTQKDHVPVVGEIIIEELAVG